MENKSVSNILSHLKELNEELNISRDRINELNIYNEQFINKIIKMNTSLIDDETEYYTKIKGVIEFIQQKQRASSAILESEKRINEIIFDEKQLLNKDIYDNEIRNITNQMDENANMFEKNLSNISYTTYCKNLGIIQTNNEYDKYLETIKDNYLETVNYFFNEKEKKFNIISKEEIISSSQLEETLCKIEEIFQREINSIEEEKNNNILKIKKEQIEKEKILFNKKIEINQKLEKISDTYKTRLTKEIVPYKNHLEFLNKELTLINQENKEKELEILDDFKLNLELVDKQLEVFKNDKIQKQDEIKCDIAITKDRNERKGLDKKLITLENEVYLFNEKMRVKKIEFDTIKEYNIKKLNLEYDDKRKVQNNKINLIQKQIKHIENTYSLEEYIQLSEIRHTTELEELKVKNDLDYIKQSNYLIDDQEKINAEYYNNIHEYQLKLHTEAAEFNKNLYNTIKDRDATLTSLEIEKNLMLKKYNTNLNSLLRKKTECASSLIKLEEEFETKQKRQRNELHKKILSQDIQLANKKNDLNKNLISIEKQLCENNIINDERFKLETQTYKIFESRFVIEKQLYELYFNKILEHLSSYSLYFTKYNNITRCSNINITGSTLDFLIKNMQNTILELLQKIINITTDRVNFEGTINFQYELNRLIQERDQNEIDYKSTSSKMDETVENYQRTINIYQRKIEIIDREAYKTENTLILKNMDLSKIDYKNPTSINKLNNEINSLRESILDYKKERKVYCDLIYKNEKLIIELTKSIGRLKKKFNKSSHVIANQLDTIEKRHKSESSIYFKFIFKIEELQKLFKMNVTKSMDENTYKNYKKYISTMQSIINEFKTNEISILLNKLESRHEILIEQSVGKNNERTQEIIDMNEIDIKTISSTYNEDVLEIEKKIEKLKVTFESNQKSIISLHKDRTNDIKNKIKNIDIIITQKKAELLYDINSFNENIKHFSSLGNKKINMLTSKRRNLSSDYFKFTDSLSNDRKIKNQALENVNINVINSLNINYKNIVKEKKTIFYKKEHSYKNQILEDNENILLLVKEYDIFNTSLETEYKLNQKNLKKELDIAMKSIKKRSNIKINKENKKYNKQINT